MQFLLMYINLMKMQHHVCTAVKEINYDLHQHALLQFLLYFNFNMHNYVPNMIPTLPKCYH